MLLGLKPKTLLGLLAGFLVLVALFLRPGGTAETTSARLQEVASKVAAPPAPVPTAAAPARHGWFAPEPEAVPSPAATHPAPITVPAGDPQPVYLDPPPSGPDFPPESR